MQKSDLVYTPIKGKTYSLFGDEGSTLPYYLTIQSLVSDIIKKFSNINDILELIRNYSNKKRLIHKIHSRPENSSTISFIIHSSYRRLNQYTPVIEEHLKSLPLLKNLDKGLGTTRLQYYLYMLEIELNNRVNKDSFQEADIKIGLLPHCLGNHAVECKAMPDGFDYKCRHCTKNCYLNEVSRIFENNQIKAYIWRSADLQKEIRSMLKKQIKPAIFGIACIPELVAGIRSCRKLKIPALGLPLDANRCARWMGTLNDTSVNLELLKETVGCRL